MNFRTLMMNVLAMLAIALIGQQPALIAKDSHKHDKARAYLQKRNAARKQKNY